MGAPETNLEAQYAAACMPERWTIFGLTLQPITLGHRLILLRLCNPIAAGGDIRIGDVIQAVWVCSMPFEVASRRVWNPLGLRLRAWAFFVQVCVWFASDYARSRLSMVSEYIRDSMQAPQVWSNAKEGQKSTVPEILLMKRTLMGAFGYSEREALSIPFSQASWECVAALEATGAVRFRTGDDTDVSKLLDQLERGELQVDKEVTA